MTNFIALFFERLPLIARTVRSHTKVCVLPHLVKRRQMQDPVQSQESFSFY